MPTVSTTITTDVEVEVEIEVYCNSCGDGMCNETDVCTTYNRKANSLRVNACPKCLEKQNSIGYDKGYEEGYEQARKEFETT